MILMSTPDFLLVLRWWGIFFLLSLAVLPVTTVIFRPFFDRGYIFAKPLALALLSYAALLLGELHLVPFTFPGLLCLGVILVLVNYGWLFFSVREKRWSVLRTFLARYGKIMLLEELLFFLILWCWAYVRSFSPDIHGLEKYMDYGFMNSISRTTFLPPKDMWLTPFSINYYYFGHLTGAVLTKLSGIPAHLTYNLILASIFAMSFVGSFSLGANLFVLIKPTGKVLRLKQFFAGLVTACLVTLSGNLHTLYAFFAPYENESPVPPWQLPFQPGTFPNAYWYPNATRFIYNTIHEFPMYSWVVADLHGHVFDIPFVITTLAVLLSLLITSQAKQKRTKRDSGQATPVGRQARVTSFWEGAERRLQNLFGHWTFDIGHLTLLSFLLAVMYMTNAWDGLIYLLLSGFFILYSRLTAGRIERFADLFRSELLVPLFTSGILLFVGFLLFSLPFSLHFKPFVSGIGVLCAPEFLVHRGTLGPFLFEPQHCQRSPWWQLLILYGFFYFFIFSFLSFLTKVKNVRLSDTFILLLIILGTFLILIPEFIYVKDIYPAHYRANTMFKLVFQSFILLSIVSAYSIVRILSSLKVRKLTLLEKVPAGLFLLITALLLFLVFLYPFQAINAYYGELKTYSGLNGTKYLETLYPTDYEAITWLNTHVSGQPVILEAQGDSYTDFARVSANTGLPTVLGWTVHEWLWRNSYDIPNPPPDPKKVYAVPAPRIAEVQTMYESPDLKETKRLLDKYHVKYVFLGILERQKYPNLDEEKWNRLGHQVFHAGVTSIYRISS